MKRIMLVGLLLAVLGMFMMPTTTSAAGFGVAITIAPPVLPVYTQPICPGDGYIFTPGYWAYGVDGYYWVPGAWVLPPRIGFLWTPGYWGWGGGGYFWHAGFWGPHVGFYGGINYGFGYGGFGYEGGYWHGGHFFYNRSVNNINVNNIHNVYNKTVVNNRDVNRVSYNGGRGGIIARPSATEMRANRDQHVAATSAQMRQESAARSDRNQLASVNHGRPAVTASARPGEFNGARNVASRTENNRSTTRGSERGAQNSTARTNTRSTTNGSRSTNFQRQTTAARSKQRNAIQQT